MSIATASDLELFPPARPLLAPLLLAATGVALADWLFYGWDVGISLALFLGLLGIAGVAGNRVQATRETTIIMAAVFVAGLATVIEDVNLLSVIVRHAGNGVIRQHRDGCAKPRPGNETCSRP